MERLQELIEACRAGDREAQDRLILKVQDKVYYHCRKMLKHEEDALDATQDVLLSMLNGLKDLREPAAFQGWLNRITINVCCKRLRDCREIPMPELTMPEDYENFDDQTIPEKVLDNEENRRMVVELVEALPEAQRLCVLCYYYDEMSIRDIAAAMGVSENTVKSRLHYARKTIREGVERYAAQGLKLYAFTPVPFLRYFLQQEAATEILVPMAAETVRQVVLASAAGAAGAAGAAKAAGAAAASSGGKAGIAAVVTKTLGGAAAQKGLAALAGLALAGSIGGSVLLSAPKEAPAEPETPPPAAVEIALPPPAFIWKGGEEAPPLEEAPEADAVPLVRVAEQKPRQPFVIEGPVVDMSARDDDDGDDDDGGDDRGGQEAPEPGIVEPDAIGPGVGEEPGPVVVPPVEEPPAEEPPEKEPEKRPPDKPRDDQDRNQPPKRDPEEDEGDDDDNRPSRPEPEDPTPDDPTGPVDPPPEEPVDPPPEEPVDPPPEKPVDPPPEEPVDPPPEEPVDPPPEEPVDPPPEEPVDPPPEEPVDPSPEEPVDPVPPQTSVVYTPNPEFGQYKGENSDGVHEFSMSIYPDGRNLPYPFLPGKYFGKLVIANGAFVGCRDQHIYGKSPGYSEVRYYVAPEKEGPFELKGIAYVTVIPETPIRPDDSWSAYRKSDLDGVFRFERTISKGSSCSYPLNRGSYYVTMESSDSNVVKALATGELRAVGPGSADIRYYTRWSEYGSWLLTATVHVTVPSPPPYIPPSTPSDPPKPSEPPKEPEEPVPVVVRKEFRTGYGCSSDFAGEWKEDLPEKLSYTSSAPSVVCVGMDGAFTTLAPGEAALTASDAADPSRQYVLDVQVEDHFVWEYDLEDLTVPVGEVRENRVVPQDLGEIEIAGVQWTSQDPLVASVHAAQDTRCEIAGVAPGETEVQAQLDFTVPTPNGYKTLEETVSFQVQVEPQAPSEEEVIEEKKRERFGFRSGYGYNSTFYSLWEDDLPANLTFVSSAPDVVYISTTGRISALSAGTAVLTAWDPDAPDHKYALTMEVQDHFDWLWDMEPVQISVETSGGKQMYNCQLPSDTRITSGVWTSSDPDIFEVKFSLPDGCQIQGMKPGTAELEGKITFQVYTADGPKTMYGTVSTQVTVDYEQETEAVELTDFGFRSGYGYTSSMQEVFEARGISLPEEGMSFYSSDYSVVNINSSGKFTTMKAGKAALTAHPIGDDQGKQYVILIEVQDGFEWRYSFDDVHVKAGETAVHSFTDYEFSTEGTEITYAIWKYQDALLLSLKRHDDNKLFCDVSGINKGMADISVSLTVMVPGCDGSAYFYPKISCRVYIEEAKEPEPPDGGETPGDGETGGGTTGGEENPGGGESTGGDENPGGGESTGGGENPGGGESSGGGENPGGGESTGGDENPGGGESTGGGENPGGGESTGGGENPGGGESSGGDENPGGGESSGGDENPGGGESTGGDENSGGGESSGGDENPGGEKPGEGQNPPSEESDSGESLTE